MILDLNDPRHELHARGLTEALRLKNKVCKIDPNPRMKRTRDALTGQPIKPTPVQKLTKMPFVTVDQMINFRKKALKVITDMSCDL